jgi:hypothetical protein
MSKYMTKVQLGTLFSGRVRIDIRVPSKNLFRDHGNHLLSRISRQNQRVCLEYPIICGQ